MAVAHQVNLSENDVSNRVMKRVQECLGEVIASGCEVTLQSDSESDSEAVSESESSSSEDEAVEAVSASMTSLAIEKPAELKVLDARGPRGALTGEGAVDLVQPIMRYVSS